MDGIEVAKEIRTHLDRFPLPKMIMVTAYGREEVMLRARQHGVDGFLLKPVMSHMLLEALQEVFELSGSHRRHEHEAGLENRINGSLGKTSSSGELFSASDTSFALNAEQAGETLPAYHDEKNGFGSSTEGISFLRRLSGLLADSDMDALENFDELSTYLHAVGMEEELPRIKRALERYDFGLALDLLTVLARKLHMSLEE